MQVAAGDDWLMRLEGVVTTVRVGDPRGKINWMETDGRHGLG